MKLNFRILLGTLTEKAVFISQKLELGSLLLNRVTRKLFRNFIKYMVAGLKNCLIKAKQQHGGIFTIFGYTETKPSMLSTAYSHFCVRKRSKLDCLLNIAPQRMLILKPNILCKLRA